MFEDAEKKSTNVAVEDIFSGVEPTANAPMKAPLNSPAMMPSAPQPASTPLMPPAYAAPIGGSNKSWKMAIIILVVLIVLVLLVILGRFLYNKMVNPAPSALTPVGNLNVNQLANEPALNVINQTQVNEQPAAVTEIDSDFDGLTDAREAELGTNPNNPDTDGDGLFDKQEVDVYKTDPLNPDTDGDTYKDGDEVKNGYNPNGPGKLFNLPAVTPAP